MSRRTGFTLIELLVVISIIALLISILLPALRKARQGAFQTQCLAHLHQICTALVMYTDDDDSFFPSRHVPNSSGVGSTSTVYSWVGKKGLGGYANIGADVRPLNRYLTSGKLDQDAEMPYARCPSDDGTLTAGVPVYDKTGTSYVASQWGAYLDLCSQGDSNISRRLAEVWKPSKLIAGVDSGGRRATEGNIPGTSAFAGAPHDWWHVQQDQYVAGFVDGHADVVTITNTPGTLHLSEQEWTVDEDGIHNGVPH